MDSKIDKSSSSSNWIAFGTIGKAHGIRGEITLWPYNPDSENIDQLHQVKIGERAQIYEIVKLRPANRKFILALKDIRDRNSAEELKGQVLFVDRQEWQPTTSEEWYVTDFKGCRLEDEAEQPWGVVLDVLQYAHAQHLLIEIERNGQCGTFELPFVAQFIVDVNLDTRVIAIAPPAGILDVVQWK